MRVIVKELSFINNALVQPGTEIEFDGVLGDHLVPVKKAKKKDEPEGQKPEDDGAPSET